jgi:hypothetical protein
MESEKSWFFSKLTRKLENSLLGQLSLAFLLFVDRTVPNTKSVLPHHNLFSKVGVIRSNRSKSSVFLGSFLHQWSLLNHIVCTLKACNNKWNCLSNKNLVNMLVIHILWTWLPSMIRIARIIILRADNRLLHIRFERIYHIHKNTWCRTHNTCIRV